MSASLHEAPAGVRLHIGLFGRRNVGKSSLMNALAGQAVSIVSPQAGTTTDVVSKAAELQPLGPVLFLDTAGLDDEGELGQQRVRSSRKALERTDLVLLVAEGKWTPFEEALVAELKARNLPVIAVLAKSDLHRADEALRLAAGRGATEVVEVSALTGEGLLALKEAVIRHAPRESLERSSILSGLVGPGDWVVLVVPIDLEAPKGRLILPQVQTLREALDCDAKAVVVKERELSDALRQLGSRPKLVVTDSQAILKVAADVPDDVPVTGFSVLYARWKGDLATFVEGAGVIDRLQSGDAVLIAEACTHHAIADDIGRVKIPRWLAQYTGAQLRFEHSAGHDFPPNLKDFRLVIQCGACMTNRREILSRILAVQTAGVPITNYGLAIAKCQGVLERMLSPFPEFSGQLHSRAGVLEYGA
ncbi:MAG: [FeFe] hydrogenase H-cluster maturation GTPase HydF [candidate division FCPU426 bacterium]